MKDIYEKAKKNYALIMRILNCVHGYGMSIGKAEHKIKRILGRNLNLGVFLPRTEISSSGEVRTYPINCTIWLDNQIIIDKNGVDQC